MENIGVSIVNALNDAVRLILTFIPRVIGFLVILIVGLILATVVSRTLTLVLRKVGFDRMANRIGLSRFEQRMGITLDPAGILGKIVYWFILLIFLVPAADALGLPAVSNILNTLVAYIPNVFVAILVLFLGTLAATFVADLVRGAVASANIGSPRIFAGIARWAIIGFSALVALEQLQISTPLINELFGGIVAAMAIAFGLAFGLGGQEAARRWLARGEGTVTTAASQISAQQSREEAKRARMEAEQARAYQQQQQAQAQAYQQPQPYQQAQVQTQPYQQAQAYQPQAEPYQSQAQPYQPPSAEASDGASEDVTTYDRPNPRNPR
ncbi:MAG: small-conductance mechanosensitive ion channel [Chloroflexi bacterium]|nr:MAG: small-conductance mechanosensitive ion channel [Chloroflexota bacterium]